MPDPTRATISATQSPALWNQSPYLTRWMLWRHFADGMPIDKPADERMDWGRRLQPLVLAQAAEDLKLEVHPNEGDDYHRRGLLGATRDAIVICPDRGRGALETKCVFDYRTWMGDWAGGKRVPRHYEIQVQQQMLVGDKEGPYTWGTVGAWVAGETHYFERQPIPALWDKLIAEAAAFFASVRDRAEPNPFGQAIELPFLSALDRPPGKVVDLSAIDGADELAADARMFAAMQRVGNEADKTTKRLKAKLLAAAGDAEEAILAGGVRFTAKAHAVAEHMRKASRSTVVKVILPRDEAPATAGPGDGEMLNSLMGG